MTKQGNAKLILRAKMLAKLKALSDNYYSSADKEVSKSIDSWLGSLPLADKLNVGYFATIANEIHTTCLEQILIKHQTNRYLPYFTKTLNLEFYSLLESQRAGSLLNKSYGVPLPHNHSQNFLAFKNFNIIFLPGLAFDLKGARLGRGKGCYDRYLGEIASLGKKPLLVGLALDQQIVHEVPTQSHDVRVNYLCTPSLGIHEIKQ